MKGEQYEKVSISVWLAFSSLQCTTRYYFRFTPLFFAAIFCCNDENFPDDLPTPAAPHVVGSYIVLPLSYR